MKQEFWERPIKELSLDRDLYGTTEYFVEQSPVLTKSFYRIRPWQFHRSMGGSPTS